MMLLVQCESLLLLLMIVKELKNYKNFYYFIQKYRYLLLFLLESLLEFSEYETICMTFYPVGVHYIFRTQFTVYDVENLESLLLNESLLLIALIM